MRDVAGLRHVLERGRSYRQKLCWWRTGDNEERCWWGTDADERCKRLATDSFFFIRFVWRTSIKKKTFLIQFQKRKLSLRRCMPYGPILSISSLYQRWRSISVKELYRSLLAELTVSPWARFFSHFMCMEKTSGLTKNCGSLWSPLVSFSYFPVFLSLCLSHLINNQLGCLSKIYCL